MHKKEKFAFLIHPRHINDFWRRFGAMIGVGEDMGMRLFARQPFNWCADFLIFYLPIIFPRLGFTNCTPTGFDAHGKATGYVIAVLLTSDQMKRAINRRRKSDKIVKWIHKKLHLPQGRKFVQNRIANAILYAQDRLDCSVVGLGAYTAPMMKDGLAAVSDPRITCTITHGDALSAASGYDAVVEAVKLKQLAVTGATIAIVGASGVVGRGMAQLLAELCPKKIILIALQRKTFLKQLAETIRGRGYIGEIVLSLKTRDITDADIVVLTTTAPGDIVDREMLRKISIVLDMAQPCNMSEQVHKQVPHILRIDGGYMKISSVKIPFEMGPPKGASFACLTETMTLAITGDRNHHVGNVDADFALSILATARLCGFTLAPLTNFSRPVV